MSLYHFLLDVLNTNSKTYAFVSIAASIGTIIALVFTIFSVNESRKQSKINSAKNSLDVIFNNIDNSLNNLTFYAWTSPSYSWPSSSSSGPEIHFGKNVIYRILAHPHISGLTSNQNNYIILSEYLNYLQITASSIRELTNDLGQENLKKFYFDKLDVEINFLTNILPEIVSLAIENETAKNKEKSIKILNELLYRINDIKSLQFY